MPPGKTTISAYNNLKQANLQTLDKFGVKKKKQTILCRCLSIWYVNLYSIRLGIWKFFYLYIEIQNEDQKSWLNPYNLSQLSFCRSFIVLKHQASLKES